MIFLGESRTADVQGLEYVLSPHVNASHAGLLLRVLKLDVMGEESLGVLPQMVRELC